MMNRIEVCGKGFRTAKFQLHSTHVSKQKQKKKKKRHPSASSVRVQQKSSRRVGGMASWRRPGAWWALAPKVGCEMRPLSKYVFFLFVPVRVKSVRLSMKEAQPISPSPQGKSHVLDAGLAHRFC